MAKRIGHRTFGGIHHFFNAMRGSPSLASAFIPFLYRRHRHGRPAFCPPGGLAGPKGESRLEMMWIALGGGIGAICRWLVTEAFPARDGKFPLGTFLVNMTGCFIMGLYLGWVHDRLPVAWMMANRPFVAGFLGGYTTFSTFSYEAERLRQQKRKGKFWAYLLSSLFLGLFLVWSGFHISSGMVS